MNNEISIPHGNWTTSLTKYDFDKLCKFPFNFHGVIHLKKNDGGIDWQKLTSALAKFFTFKPTIAFEDTTDPNDHHIHYLIALTKNQIPHHSKHLQTNYDAIQRTKTDIFPKVHLMGGYNRHLQPIRTTVSRTLRYASRQTHNEQISEVYRSNHLNGNDIQDERSLYINGLFFHNNSQTTSKCLISFSLELWKQRRTRDVSNNQVLTPETKEKNDAHEASHVPVIDNRQAVFTLCYEVGV